MLTAWEVGVCLWGNRKRSSYLWIRVQRRATERAVPPRAQSGLLVTLSEQGKFLRV